MESVFRDNAPMLPSGTITFLFTDIEGSTQLWERCPDAMRLALALHDELLRKAIERHNGHVFKTIGDAFCAAFSSAPDALNAALEAHLALAAQEWEETGPIRVRMGIHTGAAEERDADYFGPTLNRVARLQGVGHGQQTLISQATYVLVCDNLPRDVTLSDLGMHRLKDLAAPEHIRQLVHPSLPHEFPPLKSLNYLSTNLPAQLTSFIGREKEMAEIKGLLDKTRLLTLTGSGGTGKTRLSLQAAAEVLEEYPDGVWLVELAPLADAGLVANAVAETLSIREAPGEPILKTLLSSLRDKQMLLILDNCEHVLEAAARLVDALLKSCPRMSVLVSSRQALGLAGERACRVPSLSVPDLKQAYTPQSVSDYESVRLFIERAVTVKSDFTVTLQNVSALVSVCHRLDGIPLAIELAAARVRAMPVDQIEMRLDSRFRLLTGGSRTALPRQQTLRALIDWSYDMLNSQEKSLLCRLSVFAGGWTLGAAEIVCAGDGIEDWEALDLLTSLVDKSLVVYEEREGTARYRLLETVRQYARDRLVESGETEEVRNRHRDCFLALAEEAEPKLSGAEQAHWLMRLEVEHENLRAALDWSLAENGEAGLRFCGALWRFWWTRGYLSEGREWCMRALGTMAGEEQTSLRATVLNGTANLAWIQGDYASASAYQQASLKIRKQIGDLAGVAGSLGNLGLIAYSQGDYNSARAYCEECLTIQRNIGDQRHIARTLNYLGAIADYEGNTNSARIYYEESLTINRELGDLLGIGSALLNLGILAYSQSDYVAAQSYSEESLVIFRETGHRQFLANALNNLGDVAYCQGNNAAARAYYDENLVIFREIGEQRGIANSLNNLGGVASAQSDDAAAWSYYAEGLAIFRNIGDRRGIADSLAGLGMGAYLKGDQVSARSYFEESLGIRQEIGNRVGIAYSLEAFARLAAGTNQSEHAATLWGAAAALREAICSPLPPNERAEYDRNVDRMSEELGEAVFSAAWTRGRAMTLEEAIALAQNGPDA